MIQARYEEAIGYLREQAPAELLREVRELRQGSGWPAGEHFGIGLWVRNRVREGGFGWDDQTLDGVWAELIERAAGSGGCKVGSEDAERPE